MLTNNTKIALAAGLALCAGIGAFELGSSQQQPQPVASSGPVAPEPVAVRPMSPTPSQPAMVAPTTAVVTTPYAYPPNKVVIVRPVVSQNHNFVARPIATHTTTTMREPVIYRTALIKETPMLAPKAQTTYSERKTVYNTTRTSYVPGAIVTPVPRTVVTPVAVTTQRTVYAPVPVHRIYTRTIVHYRRNDKIHVARAVKHTVMFALKLPGRLTL